VTRAVSTRSTTCGDEDLGALALSKLTRVFGPERGARLHREVLREMGIEQLDRPDDLQAFARVLGGRGGMEAAVGGLLGVAATLRGAADPATASSRGRQ
jgi:hypothetical protein